MSGALCDVNIWLALTVSGHQHHRIVRAWFDQIETPGSVCFCRTTQQGFLRLLTNSAIMRPFGDPPVSNERAWTIYETLIGDDRVVFTEEPAGLERVWREFAGRSTASPNVWTDAYLAAFAFAAEMQFITTDSGFRQFQGLDLLVLGDA